MLHKSNTTQSDCGCAHNALPALPSKTKQALITTKAGTRLVNAWERLVGLLIKQKQTIDQRYEELYAEYKEAKASGMTHKIWVAVGDNDTRLAHKQMDGTKIPIDAKFYMRGSKLFLPSDPKGKTKHTIYCRCDLKYVKDHSRPISAIAQGLTVTYEYSDSRKMIKSGGSRSWRNNNSGNLEPGGEWDSISKQYEMLGTDGRFAIFPTKKIGDAAKKALLNAPSYQGRTIHEAIMAYAPPKENDTKSYIRNVANYAGATPETLLSALSDRQMDLFLQAVKRQEGWREGKVTYE